MWLANETRLDIAEAETAVVRSANKPRDAHWRTVAIVLENVPSTNDLGIAFQKGSGLQLVAFASETYASEATDGKAVSAAAIMCPGAWVLVFEDAKIRHTLYHRGRIVLIALADTIKEVMFVRYVRGFIFRVSGRRVLRLSRITRGQGTWHHTQSTPLGQTISTSDTTVYGSLVSEGILLTPHVGSEESRADVWLKPLSKHGFLNPT